ncbi:hypothetical protein [Amycolatopsis sp. NPDC059021]|uniref:hypothetical protein n=1 Tax=Amycolatopsis sp. NPDC059021 TaxID=3346704 RepID=UPI00366EC407
MRIHVDTTMTPGTIGGHATEFLPVHRQANDTPATVTATLTVPLSLEDITATIWYLFCESPLQELRDVLADAAYMHRLVLETFLAAGAHEVESERLGLVEVTPGTDGFEHLSLIRERVAHLYGAPARKPVCRTGGRRELAGVGQ